MVFDDRADHAGKFFPKIAPSESSIGLAKTFHELLASWIKIRHAPFVIKGYQAIGDALYDRCRSCLAAPQLFVRFLARSDVEKGEDDASNAVVGGAIGQRTSQEPTITGTDLALRGSEMFQSAARVRDNLRVIQSMGQIGERSANIGRDEIEELHR